MDKRDYLVKTFSRTKKKDYENYILTAIWHKLDNMEIKPVSQQYIKRHDGKYALMDLYFPQLYVGIEVDEVHHLYNHKADKIRMDDIISVINEDSIKEFICFRVDATKPLKDINKRVNYIVSYIKNKAMNLQLSWMTYEQELEHVKNQEFLSIYDDISFKDIKDITNTIFGKNSKRYQRSYFKLKDRLWLWCPKLSIVVDGDTRSAAGGWLNLLAPDWSYIDESHQNNDFIEKRSITYLEEITEDFERAVFVKYKDNLGFNRYRFVGVFKMKGISPDNEKFIRYERVKSKIEVIKSLDSSEPILERNDPL